MQIALVTGHGVMPQNGGQGSFCAHMVKGLQQRGHEVTAVTRNVASWTAWAREAGAEGVRIMRPSVRSLRDSDVVHLNNPGVRMLALASLLRKPTVVTHMGYLAFCPEGNAWPSANTERDVCSAGPARLGPCPTCPRRAVVRQAHVRLQSQLLRRVVNVGISRYVADRLGFEEAIVGPFDVSSVPDLSEVPVEPRLAYIGRLVPEKGVDVAIRALVDLPGVTLDVYGHGPYRPALEAEAQRLGVAARVRFQGSCPEPIPAIRHHAALVVPSVWDEPLGYVTMEGMAAGKAVIAAATGGTVELLTDDRGWLVPAADAAALARAVTSVLADDAERRRRVRRAREFVRSTLEPARVAQEYERVYRTAV